MGRMGRLRVGNSHIDGSNRIVSAILAVTLFTEARWENNISMALVGFTIFKRADYQSRCIVHAAANSHYSQWLLAHDILNGSIPSWIRSDCKHKPLPACIEANKLIILDTVKYASQSPKRGQQLNGLKRSIEVAKCITNNLTGISEISKKYKIGTHFIMPTKVYTKAALQQHPYTLSQTRSICPNNTGQKGFCTRPASWKKDKAKDKKVDKGLALHYFELETDTSPNQIASLYNEVSTMLQQCRIY
jgi:hypothetical protein